MLFSGRAKAARGVPHRPRQIAPVIRVAHDVSDEFICMALLCFRGISKMPASELKSATEKAEAEKFPCFSKELSPNIKIYYFLLDQVLS